MNLDDLVKVMSAKPYLLGMGKNLIASRYNATTEDVVKAKNIARLGREIPKVLIFDIETAPLKAYIWKTWRTNVHNEQLLSDWFCLAWSAKWLYSENIMGDVVTPEEVAKEDDKRIMTKLWGLIDKADIVVAHNSNKFDIPRINSRFIVNGLTPTKPFFSIDTCLIARKQFNFTSNKLDALAGYFGIEHKLDTDFSLWKRCLEGDQEALNYMLEYNKKDVAILEEIYLKLRPWIKNHPNMGNLSSKDDACANCGSTSLTLLKDQYYYTNVGKYNIYRCNTCGAISRSRHTVRHRPNITNVGK